MCPRRRVFPDKTKENDYESSISTSNVAGRPEQRSNGRGRQQHVERPQLCVLHQQRGGLFRGHGRLYRGRLLTTTAMRNRPGGRREQTSELPPPGLLQRMRVKGAGLATKAKARFWGSLSHGNQ